MPTDMEHEASLRDAVRVHYANPDEEATTRSIRTKSEQDLGLEEGFYKNDDTWKDKSKEIIQDQFNKCEAERAAKTEEAAENKKSLKRASPATNSRPRKKSKLEEDDESTALSDPPETATEENSEEQGEDYTPKKKAISKPIKKTTKAAAKSKPAPAKKAKLTAKPKRDSSTSELSDAPSEGLSEPPENAVPSKANEDDAEDSSSELSSVIDEPPPGRKSSKSKNGSVSKPGTSKSSKTKAPAESDPKAEEIKRLQGWLVKCGIRKVWGKELKPFGTQNAKISHLKSMLSDAGMTGRFSNEKAAQIKEARELAADIEAVQEGNERWGKDGEDDEEQPDRGGRRLVRGAKNYAFLSSDGEEESD